jgi:excisionase family DNA binding protein
MNQQVLTTTEVFREFGVHLATVYRLIVAGRVAAHKDVNGRWLIRRADIERWSRGRRVLRSTPAAESVA